MSKDQNVTVDHGDLLEACQAANAWASALREKARESRKLLGALPIADDAENSYMDAAYRIDFAVMRLRQEAFISSGVDSTKEVPSVH